FRGGVYFTIADEGKGFDYLSLLASDYDVEKSRGLFLMKKLSDNISFSDNGSKVRLDFIINGIEPSRALERISILKRHYSFKTVESC
ncbi:MAG: ATP-binding protein, partial [Bacteroidales bacterium]|nr:ATP-binding protein [Bacteroidales bacterium]